MTVLSLHNLSLSYGAAPLLIEVNLSIAHGQWVALLGRSGCGKSTLIKTIAQLIPETITSGTIRTNANIAYMAQKDGLLPWLSVIDNVQLANRLHGTISADTRAKAKNLLAQIGLADKAEQPPYCLSGGQRQRVALARTLMHSAELILMDEPFSAVDAITRLELQELASQMLSEKTVIFITHDPAEAVRLADDIYVINNQRLSQSFQPLKTRPRCMTEIANFDLQAQLLAALS